MGKTELALAYAHAFAWDYLEKAGTSPLAHSRFGLALIGLSGSMQIGYTEEEAKDSESGRRLLAEVAPIKKRGRRAPRAPG